MRSSLIRELVHELAKAFTRTDTTLTRDQVPAGWRAGYEGDRFEQRVGCVVSIANKEWSLGFDHTYKVFDLITDEIHELDVGACLKGRNYASIPIEPDQVIVEHAIYRDQDLGLVIYGRPENSQMLTRENL